MELAGDYRDRSGFDVLRAQSQQHSLCLRATATNRFRSSKEIRTSEGKKKVSKLFVLMVTILGLGSCASTGGRVSAVGASNKRFVEIATMAIGEKFHDYHLEGMNIQMSTERDDVHVSFLQSFQNENTIGVGYTVVISKKSHRVQSVWIDE